MMDGDEEADAVIEKKPRKVLIGVVWAAVLTLLAVVLLFGVIKPHLLSKQSEGYATEAYMNARSFGLALYGFAGEWGAYPCDETASKLMEEFSDQSMGIDLAGDSSNAYFRQLIVSGYCDMESPFRARIGGEQKPDNNIDGANMLAAGECGYSYVVWGVVEDLPEKAPLVITPLVRSERKFDEKPFKGRVVVLHVDATVSEYKMDRDGKVMVNGMDFFDPKNPHWGGRSPRIVWPE